MLVLAILLFIFAIVFFTANKKQAGEKQNETMKTQVVGNHNAKYLFFDTETTGLPDDQNASYKETDNWPRIVSLSWILEDGLHNQFSCGSFLVRPEGFSIPSEAQAIHGISTRKALEEGYSLEWVLMAFQKQVAQCDYLVAHNIFFDMSVTGAEFHRLRLENPLLTKYLRCTMRSSTNYCAIPSKRYGFKWPKLQELHIKLFGAEFSGAHNSLSDVQATKKCFWELMRRGIIK